MQDSLLWVYEGQTQYWGEILTARSGLWSYKQAIEALALTAAYYDHESGRTWRSLADTTNDEIINPRRPQAFESWQRFEDYYSEGQLIWLEADTIIRQLSHQKKSMDDFAKLFFGVNDASHIPLTYTFDDVVSSLQVIQPYDWKSFLEHRVNEIGLPAPLAGIEQAGYHLVYNNETNEILSARDHERDESSFKYSLGLTIDKDGKILNVIWNSSAFKANLAEGMEVLAINGLAYNADRLTETLKASIDKPITLELMIRDKDQFRVTHIDYQGGLMIPHLEPIKGRLDLLQAIYKAK
jgi:predicted metalloprotease with PDZ domain